MIRNLLLFSLSMVLLTGCTKFLQPAEDRLVGSWTLAYAEKQRLFNTTTIYTGYENGVFYFYDNGEAIFDDGQIQMRGSWQLRLVNGGYYDANGNWQNGTHQVFVLHLVNFQYNQVLHWEFDNSYFTSNRRFVARYQSYSYDYKYVFNRY